VLARGQEGHSAEEVGIPQWQLTFPQALHDELLPDVVLQDEVAEEAVVRGQGHASPLCELAVRLPLEEVIEGEQRLPREEHRPEKDGRQEGQDEKRNQMGTEVSQGSTPVEESNEWTGNE